MLSSLFHLQQLSLREIRVLTVIVPHTLVLSLQTYAVNIRAVVSERQQSKKKKVRCEVHVSWEESRAPQEQYEGWCEAMCLVIARGKSWAFRMHKG